MHNAYWEKDNTALEELSYDSLLLRQEVARDYCPYCGSAIDFARVWVSADNRDLVYECAQCNEPLYVNLAI